MKTFVRFGHIARLRTFAVGLVLLSGSFLASCSQDETALNQSAPETNPLVIPPDFPKIETPADNPVTASKVELGRRLFFDTRLSINGKQSCASCHNQGAAFSDSGKAVSIGTQGQIGSRNAPAIINIAYSKALFWDGRAHTMEEQAVMPITNPIELNSDTITVKNKLSKEQLYKDLFKKVFGDEKITMERIGKAIATFERMLLSGDSPFDRFMRGDKSALSESALRGFMLFKDKLVNCIGCHLGPSLTDDDYHSTGLQRFYDDEGREGITHNSRDNGKFKTPSLRNILLTGPYMHNGMFKTLLDVLKHYNEGGQHSQQQDTMIKPLHLTTLQMLDIIEFLKSLTDSKFITDLRFKDPWKG